jgi:hypothetical protein
MSFKKNISLFQIMIYLLIIAPTYAQYSGKAGVVLIDNPASPLLEIRNEFFGVAIPKEKMLLTKDSKKSLAPIQSIIYTDGTYSDTSLNFLYTDNKAHTAKVTIIKESVDLCIVEVKYLFNKQEFSYNNGIKIERYPKGGAGAGFYKFTITVKKGKKSAIIEEETDYDFYYEVNIGNGLNPNQARYRGWSSDSYDNGHEETGIIYRQENQRTSADAIVDLNYEKMKILPLLSLWDPAGGEINTGRYWLFYNNNAGNNANLLGFFQGKPSRLIGARFVGPRLQINVKGLRSRDLPGRQEVVQENTHAAVSVESYRRGPDNSWEPKKRFQWCLYVSTRKDLLKSNEYQPIGKEMNYVSGVADKVDKYCSEPALLHQTFFDGGIYMPAKKMQKLIERVKTDERFYKYLCQMDLYLTPILNSWRNPDSAISTIKSLVAFKKDIIIQLKEKDGIHNFQTKYWMAGINFKQAAQKISCLFADKTIKIQETDKEELLQLTRLMARLLWDNDYVPFFDSSGASFGTANMYFMYNNNGRSFFALLFRDDPQFQKRAKETFNLTSKDLRGVLYKNGSTFGTPHYIQASIDPVLYTMLQLKHSGAGDLFWKHKDILYPFIDFYSSFLTPPSVRFNQNRKLISFGDGSEESAVTFALLAAGVESFDKPLADRLSYIFQHGSPRMAQFGHIALTVDLVQNSSSKPSFGSSNYTGYFSHFRVESNTERESAVWILNGEGYFDHRHDDRGEVSIYALKAPLSLSRSSFYYPRSDNAKIKSMVIPESLFPEWNQDKQPINGTTSKGSLWQKSDQIEFAKFKNSNISKSIISNEISSWYRQVGIISIDEDKPVIVFYDSAGVKTPYIWSMLFMSDGSINTPVGHLQPINKIWDYQNPAQQELPAATPQKELNLGLNAFTFTGQEWSEKLHITKGIDWMFLSMNSSSSSFTLSQWTNNWQNTQEAEEFTQSTGKPYSETQQILRIKSNTPFFNVLLPFYKGKNPYIEPAKIVSAETINISYGNGHLLLSKNFHFYSDKNRVILTTYNTKNIMQNGFGVEGGPTEIEMKENNISIRVHGNSGIRTITLPFNISNSSLQTKLKIVSGINNTKIIIDHKSKGKDLLSTEQGYESYELKK